MAISQRLTLDEFLRLPEEEPALELIDGRITQKVAPQGEHSVLKCDVAERVNRFARPKILRMIAVRSRT